MNHDELCEKMERDFPPIHDFLETWGAHCGAPRNVFRDHLFAMLREVDAMSGEVDSGKVLLPRELEDARIEMEGCDDSEWANYLEGLVRQYERLLAAHEGKP